MPDASYRPPVAAGLVFVASGAVLVLEILGIRLLAPYVGLTLETTTAIIGTVLAGIAAGAAFGGRAADEVDPRLLLPMLLAAGGGMAIATVPLVRLLGPGLRGGGDLAALLITLIALFPAATVLSAVTPAVAKLQLRDLERTGSVVGRLSAWATGGALVALGLLLGLRGRSPLLLAAAALATAAVSLAVGAPCDVESRYHCAVVVEDGSRPGGRTLVLDDLRHSYVDLDDPRHLEFAYVRWIGDAIDGIEPAGAALDAVFLGGGGFTLPRYLAATRPGSRSRVLEVDEPLVELARDRLGLRTGAALQVRAGDARMTLRGEPDASADLLVGDAFGGRSVPWHLATIEFHTEIRRVLRPRGVYALNVIDQPPLRLVRAQAATLLDGFADVALVARPGPAGGNLVLLASESPLPPAVASTAHGARTLGRAEVERFAAGAEPLRDDDAPADQLRTGA